MIGQPAQGDHVPFFNRELSNDFVIIRINPGDLRRAVIFEGFNTWDILGEIDVNQHSA